MLNQPYTLTDPQSPPRSQVSSFFFSVINNVKISLTIIVFGFPADKCSPCSTTEVSELTAVLYLMSVNSDL